MQVELRGGFIVFVGVLRGQLFLVGLRSRFDELLLLNDFREQLLVICLFLSKYLLEFFVVHELVEHQRVLNVLQELEATAVLRLLHVLLLLFNLLHFRGGCLLRLRLVFFFNSFFAHGSLLAVAGLRRDVGTVTRHFFVQHGRRLVKRVDCNAERVVQKLRDDAGQQGTADLETWVRVGLDHNHFEIFINHKVVPKNFKRIFVAMRVQTFVDGPERVSNQAFHDWKQIAHKAHVLRGVVLVQVPLEIVDGKFVSRFELTVVVRVHLNCVVSQMNKPALKIR